MMHPDPPTTPPPSSIPFRGENTETQRSKGSTLILPLFELAFASGAVCDLVQGT